jgi:hypothetical protein
MSEKPAASSIFRDHHFTDGKKPTRLKVQIDVKYITLRNREWHRVRRFQYTAIVDATRIRTLQIYDRHTQKNAITFVDFVVEKFPFRIHTVRTDHGHEFQALFHWHVEDRG